MNICGGIGCNQQASKKCSKCQFGYCSRSCQKNDWSRHKNICCNYTITSDPNYCPSSSQVVHKTKNNHAGSKFLFHETEKNNKSMNVVPSWKPIWDQASNAYVDGMYQEASKLFAECLRLAIVSNGEEHILICQILRNMGASYQRLNKLSEAEEEYLKGIKIAEDLMWKGSNSALEVLVQVLEGLASLYTMQDRVEEAEPICIRCLQLSEENFGNDNPKIVNALRRLSGLRERQGRKSEAVEHLQRALKVVQDSLGRTNGQAVLLSNELVELFTRLNRLNDAEEQALKFYRLLSAESRRPEEEVYLADCAFALGNIYRARRDFAKAQPLFEEALRIRIKFNGKNHISVAHALDGVSVCRQKQGDIGEETESMMLEVLRINRLIDGADGTNVAAALYFLSSLYADRGEFSRAETCQKRALDMKIRLCGPQHVDVGACYSNIAHTHRSQGKFIEAREEFKKAYEILSAAHGPRNDICAKIFIDIEVCSRAISQQLQQEREEVENDSD